MIFADGGEDNAKSGGDGDRTNMLGKSGICVQDSLQAMFLIIGVLIISIMVQFS